jgi:hypothetical protein
MKQRIGAVGFLVGLIGTGFAMGGVENAQSAAEWITVVGVAATSLMLMQFSVWMINDQVWRQLLPKVASLRYNTLRRTMHSPKDRSRQHLSAELGQFVILDLEHQDPWMELDSDQCRTADHIHSGLDVHTRWSSIRVDEPSTGTTQEPTAMSITLHGLTKQQHQIADMIWSCESQEDVDRLKRNLPAQYKQDAETVHTLMIAAVMDQYMEITADVQELIRSISRS